MRKINNPTKLDYFISKHKIDEIFSKDMKQYMELIHFSKREYICKVDDQIEYLYFFVKGKAKVYSLLKNGKSLLLCFYKSFEVIGELEILNNTKANTNVQVIEDTYCVAVPIDVIKQYAQEDAQFYRYMCDWLSQKLVRITRNSSINLLYPLENRLASYILAIATSTLMNDVNHIVFEGNLTEMSEMLGTSYRHLLRTINKLCGYGVIEKRKGYYEIINKKQLEELAGDLYQ